MTPLQKLVSISFAFVGLWVPTAYAYNEVTTHPALTEEIVDYYNSIADPSVQIAADEKEWIIEGSTKEDEAPRWTNHLYDPTTGKGWSGSNTALPGSTIQFLASLGISNQEPLSAVEWINNSFIQEKYRAFGGDRTWKRGLEYMVAGDRREAYRTLGYALHLLEDMGVPDHTRDDTHIDGVEPSPYEEYAKRWTRANIGSLNIPGLLKSEFGSPPSRAKIEDYLVAMAKYSNEYFFSKDTINDPKYSAPTIVREDENFAYGLDEFGREFPLARFQIQWNENLSAYSKFYEIDFRPSYYPIFDAYFSRLSKQIVLNGAVAIQLWKKQVEEKKVNDEFTLYKTNRDLGKLINFPVISALGLVSKFQSWTTNLAGAALSTLDRLRLTVVSVLTEEQAPLEENKEIPVEITSDFPSTPSTTAPLATPPIVPKHAPFPTSPVVEFKFKTESPASMASATSPLQPASSTTSEIGHGGGGWTPSHVSSDSIVPHVSSTVELYNLRVSYDRTRIALAFTWSAEASTTFALDRGGVRLYEGSEAEFEESLTTVGGEASYVFTAIRDGEVSSGTVSVQVPGLLEKVRFYPDARTVSSGRQVLDVTYPTLPLLPVRYSQGGLWQGIVFYLNRPPDRTPILFEHSLPTGVAGVPLDISNCVGGNVGEVLIVAAGSAQCGSGGGLRSAATTLDGEDGRSILPTDFVVGDREFTSSDYVTVAYYEFNRDNGGDLQFIAADETPHYWSAAPPFNESPVSPTFTVSFDEVNSRISIVHDPATDPDSPDTGLMYQVNYASSSVIDPAAWRTLSALPVTYGESYLVSLRVIDEFGAISDPFSLTWNFPDNYAPKPGPHLGHDLAVSAAGTAQSFIARAGVSVNRIYLWEAVANGCCGENYVEIRRDAGGGPGELIASSSASVYSTFAAGPQEVAYVLPDTNLEAGATYWIVPVDTGRLPVSVFYGASGNPYSEGVLSQDADKDIYFKFSFD